MRFIQLKGILLQSCKMIPPMLRSLYVTPPKKLYIYIYTQKKILMFFAMINFKAWWLICVYLHKRFTSSSGCRCPDTPPPSHRLVLLAPTWSWPRITALLWPVHPKTLWSIIPMILGLLGNIKIAPDRSNFSFGLMWANQPEVHACDSARPVWEGNKHLRWRRGTKHQGSQPWTQVWESDLVVSSLNFGSLQRESS